MGKNKEIVFLKVILLRVLVFISIIMLLLGVLCSLRLIYKIDNYEDSLRIDYEFDLYEDVKKQITEEVQRISKEEYEIKISNFSSVVDHTPLIFPKTISSNQCEYLEYQQEIHGTVLKYRVQLYLKNQFYDKSSYLEEIDRLKALEIDKSNNKQLIYFDDLFDLPAYVGIYNYYSAFEYAVCDLDNMVVYYVFLYDVGLRNMKIPSFLIPYKLLRDTSYKENDKYINQYYGVDVYYH